MKYDIQLLILLAAIGIFAPRLSWKAWLGVGVLVFVWMMYNWFKG